MSRNQDAPSEFETNMMIYFQNEENSGDHIDAIRAHMMSNDLSDEDFQYVLGITKIEKRKCLTLEKEIQQLNQTNRSSFHQESAREGIVAKQDELDFLQPRVEEVKRLLFIKSTIGVIDSHLARSRRISNDLELKQLKSHLADYGNTNRPESLSAAEASLANMNSLRRAKREIRENLNNVIQLTARQQTPPEQKPSAPARSGGG